MKLTVLILRHMLHEPGGTLETALQSAGLGFRYVDLFREVPVRLPLDESTGLIVLGGAMNVDETDRYSFLARDVQWIEEALSRKLPVLGICLGAQLLAKTLGAKVYPAAQRNRLVPGRAGGRGGPRSAVRPAWYADHLPVARRHVRPARRGDPLGPQPGVREPSVPLRAERLWAAVPHRDDRRDDR